MFMRVPRSTRLLAIPKGPTMEILYERVAAIDVGKKIVAVAVRTPGERVGRRRQQVRKFNTFHQTLAEMVACDARDHGSHRGYPGCKYDKLDVAQVVPWRTRL